MKIIADRKKLAEAFNIAAAFTSRNNVKPILQHVKIVANSEVQLMATDLEVGCRLNVEGVTVEKPGEAMLPVDRIGGLLKECSDEWVEIEASKDKLKAKTSRGDFAINATDCDEFPDVVGFGDVKSYWAVDAADIKHALAMVAMATDPEAGRYALQGVLLEQHDNNLMLVATDGRRIAKCQVRFDMAGRHEPAMQVIARPERLSKVFRPFADKDVIKIHCRDNDILFAGDCGSFYLRLIEGRFPDWRRIDLPAGEQFSVHAGFLLSHIRQASLMLGKGKEDSRSLDFMFSNGTLTLSAEAADRGKSVVEMPVPYEGKQLRVTLDCDYAAEWLAAVSPDSSIEFTTGNGSTAVGFSFNGSADYTLMPLSKD